MLKTNYLNTLKIGELLIDLLLFTKYMIFMTKIILFLTF
jgi:hypothetical protein